MPRGASLQRTMTLCTVHHPSGGRMHNSPQLCTPVVLCNINSAFLWAAAETGHPHHGRLRSSVAVLAADVLGRRSHDATVCQSLAPLPYPPCQTKCTNRAGLECNVAHTYAANTRQHWLRKMPTAALTANSVNPKRTPLRLAGGMA